MSILHRFRLIIAAANLLLILNPSLRATPVEFTVDESQSTISLTGNVLGIALQQQGPGSLNSTYFGTIKADLSGSQIQFPGGSVLKAQTNGVWSPGPGGTAGSAPADYGAQASLLGSVVKGALRNLLLDLTSGPLTISNNQFDASVLRFSFPTNSTSSFDYSTPLGSAGIALTGISTNKIVNGATLITVGDVQTLTIQVDTEFKFEALSPNDSSVHLTGKLVATKASQPAITSIVVKNQTVTLQVQGAGPAPRLDSSTNLTQWTTRNPTITPQAGGAILSLPANGPLQFYRAAK